MGMQWVYFRVIVVELQWTVEIPRILYSSARRATCRDPPALVPLVLTADLRTWGWGLEPVIGTTAEDDLSYDDAR